MRVAYCDASTLPKMLALLKTIRTSKESEEITYTQHTGNDNLWDGIGRCLYNPPDCDQNITNEDTIASAKRHTDHHDKT